jgi:regulator of protease activity HflC (stomatin/prohibitin superfamily)
VLPPRIQEAIQQKREEEQIALLYNFRLDREEKEAERKRIEARGIRDFQDIITGGLSDKYLLFKGIEATAELAKSPNAKVIVFGDKSGLPLLLGNVPFGPGEPPRPE